MTACGDVATFKGHPFPLLKGQRKQGNQHSAIARDGLVTVARSRVKAKAARGNLGEGGLRHLGGRPNLGRQGEQRHEAFGQGPVSLDP